MKKHVTIAAFVLVLAAYSLGETNYRESQDQAPAASTQPNQKLSKKDRKRQEKEEKKARKQERKDQKRIEKEQTEEQRKQYKEEEKRAAKERRREQKGDQKEVASERKKDEKYERKQAQEAEQRDARDMKRHIEREARVERAAAAPPRIPISTTATPGLLMAQRDVGRAIYSQVPGSDVRVLLNGGNQIVLRGAASSPSLRQRLLQAAIGAARGYSVVDQLAANLVSDAAGAATSAAFGGMSDLIHGHGSNAKDAGPDSSPESGPDSVPQPSANAQQAPPNTEQATVSAALDPGSNACVNLANPNQALLTGQVASQASAELIRRFAHQLASPSAVLVDQLAVRANGTPNPGTAPEDVAGTSDAGTTASANSPATVVSPGSAVCVSGNHGEISLTGNVASAAELGAVENAAQPLVATGRLVDQLTIGSMNSGNQIAAASTPAGAETAPPQTEVEQVLHSVPRLANVNVQVAADGVHLSGSVDTTQDDQVAADLVRQYAPGRPVLDNMTVANRMPPPQN